MTNPNFQEVTDRLLLALGITKETDLGKLLGFTQSAWSTRKMRGSLPTAAINALIAQEAINLDFIYKGTGGAYEGAGWAHEYKARAVSVRLAKAYLTPMGHDAALVDALVRMDAKDKYKSNAYGFITALRDSYKISEYDLTLLITGIDAHQHEDAKATKSFSKEEQDLIDSYRSADKQGQAFIRRSANMSADKPKLTKTKQTAGDASVQIAGGAGSGNTFNTGSISPSPARRNRAIIRKS